MSQKVDILTEIESRDADYLVTRVNNLVREGSESSIATLGELLATRSHNTYLKHAIPHYVARAFLCLGTRGIEELARLHSLAPGSIYPSAILVALCRAALGRPNELLMIGEDREGVLKPTITEEMRQLARRKVQDIVMESLRDIEAFDHFVTAIQQLTLLEGFEGSEETSKEIMKLVSTVISEATLSITSRTLDEFQSLIETAGLPEETYQNYLEQHALVLDPLAKDVIPKHQLVTEFVTDFVIRRLDDRYVLVEIEKPGDVVFTKKNDLSSKATHAVGQVIDFQEWVESNVAYAQKRLPNVTSPTGLVIIGRSKDLSGIQKRKLARYNTALGGRVEVLTFDDLLQRAERLYRNIHS